MFVRAAICLVLLFFASAAFGEDAKNRVALVIGNAAYKRSALANPVNDAKLMAERLKAQGFDVFTAYDASQRDMKRAVQSFAATLRERGKDAVAFVFYSGHGVQMKGENYLIPVDEHIKAEGDVDIDAVSLSSIMSELKNAKARLAIVVLDACRDNPFGYARGGPRGLAGVDAPRGSLIAFSTAPGATAPDGPAGGNSYYTAALARAIAEPGLEIEKVFKKVRREVDEKTLGEQTPWESTSLTGDFYPAGEKPAASAAASQTEPLAKLQQLTSVKPTPQPAPQYEDAAQHLVRTLTEREGLMGSVAFSPDGSTVLSGACDQYSKDYCTKGSLKLWDIGSGRELRSFTGHTGAVWSVVISPDGRYALSGSCEEYRQESVPVPDCVRGGLKLWNLSNGRELRTFSGHTQAVYSVAILPDGRTALSGSCDESIRGICVKGSLKMWDLASGRELRSFTASESDVQFIAISPDGRMVIAGGSLATPRLWDLATGRELQSFAIQGASAESAAFSPQGRFFLLGCNDNTLKLWDTNGRELRSFAGHTNWVKSVAISPDGRFALSGSEDKTMKLWDIASGRELHSFSGHTSTVYSVAISPDGRLALSGSFDNTLKLWDISEWTQPNEARR